MSKKFDPRLESLVVETKTQWDPGVGELSGQDRDWLSAAVHTHPERAISILYERAHTGFTRVITVTLEDIQRIYQERASA